MLACSLASRSRVRALRMPFQASLSTLSSCKPRASLCFVAGSSVSLDGVGIGIPNEGGTKPGGGALMAEGAIRECRIWASEDRIAL